MNDKLIEEIREMIFDIVNDVRYNISVVDAVEKIMINIKPYLSQPIPPEPESLVKARKLYCIRAGDYINELEVRVKELEHIK